MLGDLDWACHKWRMRCSYLIWLDRLGSNSWRIFNCGAVRMFQLDRDAPCLRRWTPYPIGIPLSRRCIRVMMLRESLAQKQLALLWRSEEWNLMMYQEALAEVRRACHKCMGPNLGRLLNAQTQ